MEKRLMEEILSGELLPGGYKPDESHYYSGLGVRVEESMSMEEMVEWYEEVDFVPVSIGEYF